MALAPKRDLFGVPSKSQSFPVQLRLMCCVHSDTAFLNLSLDICAGMQNAFAGIARFVTIAQFDGFTFSGGSPGGNLRGRLDTAR